MEKDGMEKEIIKMVIQNLKLNMEMGKKNNIIMMVNQNLKENI